MLPIPREYSKMLVSRWTPIPEMTARPVSKSIRRKVSAQPDSQVPNPASPLTGRTEVSSAPLIPRMNLEKLRSAEREAAAPEEPVEKREDGNVLGQPDDERLREHGDQAPLLPV